MIWGNRTGFEKTLIILGAIVVGLVAFVASVYFGYFTLPGPSTPPEKSARYYPDDVVFYTYMTLNPGGRQTRDMADIFSRLMDMRAIRDLEEDMADDLDDATGIEFEDIGDWVGWEISMALMEVSRDGEIKAAGTVGVRDRSLANQFVEDLVDYLEDENYADYGRDSYEDFDVWIDQNSDELALALSDNLLVVATTEDSLEDVLDRVGGNTIQTLSANENFQDAKAALPDRRFASMYLSYDNLIDFIEDTSEAGIFYEGGGCADQFFQTPDWLAASVGWVERGLVLDIVSPAIGDAWPEAPELTDVSKALPDDTLGFIAASFNPDLDTWRDALSQCKISDLVGDSGFLSDEIAAMRADWVWQVESISRASRPRPAPDLDIDSTLDDILDFGLWSADHITGVDIENDFINHLRGDLILAVNEFDIQAVTDRPDQNPVEAVLMLSYHPDQEEHLRETADEFISLLEDEFDLDFDSASLGGGEATARVLDIGTDYTPGYVLHDGFFTIGTTKHTLEAIATLQEDGSLSSDSEYRRVIQHLPDDPDILGYIDLRKVIDMAQSFDDSAIDRDVYDALEKSLSALAFSSSLKGEYSRFTLALTLFP